MFVSGFGSCRICAGTMYGKFPQQIENKKTDISMKYPGIDCIKQCCWELSNERQ